jgi:hypothetical protein
LALLTDVYPPFEGDYPIRLEVQYPEKLSRWKVFFWKVITAIPHFVVLLFLWMAAALCVVVAWLVILFSGRCPREIQEFIAGVGRWGLRVQAYVFSLTDEYPPFSLSDDAGPAGGDTYVVASIIGGLVAIVSVVGLAALAVVLIRGLPAQKVLVPYTSLTQGRVNTTSTMVDVWDANVTLVSANDPADELVSVVVPGQGERLVAFEMRIENTRTGSTGRVRIRETDFRLKDSNGNSLKPVIVTANGQIPPVDIAGGGSSSITAVFLLSNNAKPVQLRFARPFLESFSRPIDYEFE